MMAKTFAYRRHYIVTDPARIPQCLTVSLIHCQRPYPHAAEQSRCLRISLVIPSSACQLTQAWQVASLCGFHSQIQSGKR